jgi:hypothetical protein
MKNARPFCIETLESRIAPATLVNSTTVTYLDVDGDLVTVKTNRGSWDLATDFVFKPEGNGERLQRLELSGKDEFRGAALTISAEIVSGGNGFVDVGCISAHDLDLGAITIDGDLGRLAAGDSVYKTPGLASLTVRSLGQAGLATQEAGGSLVIGVDGRLGKLTVTNNVKGTEVYTSGSPYGTIGSIDIGGSLIGSSVFHGGSIHASGDIGRVTIGGNIMGGAGSYSGVVASLGNIGSVTVGGTLYGGTTSDTGGIQATNLGPVKVGLHVLGGAGIHTGFIEAYRNIASVSIGGSLTGGSKAESGIIQTRTAGNIGPVSIAGSVTGGDEFNAGSIVANHGDIASVKIGHKLSGGAGNRSGQIATIDGGNIGPVKIGTITGLDGIFGGDGVRSGSIEANAGNIASVTVNGRIVGSSGDGSGAIRTSSGGNIGPVSVSESIFGGSGSVSGAIYIFANGNVASVTIGKNLVGSTGSSSGSIRTEGVGKIGQVKIGGAMAGGQGPASGSILSAFGSIKGVTVGSFVSGGASDVAGSIYAGDDIGPVAILGDLFGSSGDRSGVIYSQNGDLQKVTVGGSVRGGLGLESGGIKAAHGNVSSVRIGIDLVGVSVSGAISASDSGFIDGQKLGTILIGGNFVSGMDTSTGTLTNSGVIRAGQTLQSLTISGDVTGNTENKALISARGQANAGGGIDLAIGSVKIGGGTKFLEILAGAQSTNGPFENADAQIGSVRIDGNCYATSIAAGINSGNGYFGDTGDYGLASYNDQAAIFSRIASIVIGGAVDGTGTPGDHFGFVAEHIGSLKIGGSIVALTSGAKNNLTPINIASLTDDVSVLEVA